jgi:hypothetical protein
MPVTRAQAATEASSSSESRLTSLLREVESEMSSIQQSGKQVTVQEKSILTKINKLTTTIRQKGHGHTVKKRWGSHTSWGELVDSSNTYSNNITVEETDEKREEITRTTTTVEQWMELTVKQIKQTEEYQQLTVANKASLKKFALCEALAAAGSGGSVAAAAAAGGRVGAAAVAVAGRSGVAVAAAVGGGGRGGAVTAAAASSAVVNVPHRWNGMLKKEITDSTEFREMEMPGKWKLNREELVALMSERFP